MTFSSSRPTCPPEQPRTAADATREGYGHEAGDHGVPQTVKVQFPVPPGNRHHEVSGLTALHCDKDLDLIVGVTGQPAARPNIS